MNLFELNINGYEVIYVFWNIFLAMIPVVLVYQIARHLADKKWSKLGRKNQIGFGLVFLVWLFFFPNTVYLFTMPRHLVNYCNDPNFYDVCVGQTWMVFFFFTYALIGLFTYLYSLERMQVVWSKLFGSFIGRFFPIIVIPLTALGLLFGLFNRLNSWEVVQHPLYILRQALTYFTDPTLLFNFLFATGTLYLVYYGSMYLICKIKK